MTNPNDPIYPQSEDKLVQHFGQEAYATVSVGGLTKREYFAAKAESFENTATPEDIAKCLDWPTPTFNNTQNREWFLWWRSAIAAWKVAEADALIAELNKEINP